MPKWKKSLTTALMGILLLFISTTAVAEEQDPPIKIKVNGVYGNYIKPGTWLSLRLEVSNQGPDVQGKLAINLTNNLNGPNYKVQYTTGAVIPQGTTKIFYMQLPVNQYMGSIQADLISGGKSVAKGKSDFTFLGQNQLVVGLLDRKDDNLGALSSLKVNGSLAPVLISVKGEELPDKADLLALFDALLIDDVDLKLSSEQAKALVAWVSQGGTLVIGGGSGWQKVVPNLPAELQPAQVTGVADMSLKSGVLGNNLNPPREAVKITKLGSSKGSPVYSQDGIPLVLQQKYGSGKVVYLAFDPTLEPLASWSGMKTVWQGLQLHNGTVPDVQGQAFAKGDPNVSTMWFSGNPWGLMNSLNAIPGLQVPSVRNTFIFLALYILLAGVVVYLVLKKLDKREWTWFVVPALSLLFILIMYLASMRTGRSDVVLNQINIVNASSDSSTAQVVTASGLFVAGKSKFELQLKDNYLINFLPIQEPTMQNDTLLAVDEGRDKTSIQMLKMNSWSMRGFATAASISLQGGVSSELISRDNKWFAVLTNHTGYDFSDGVIVANPFWFAKVPALKSGQKIEVEIPLGTFQNKNLNGGPPLSYQIYDPNINWKGPGAPPRSKQSDMVRQQVLESVLGPGPGVPGKDQIYFFGWSSSPLKGVIDLNLKSAQSFSISVFKVPISLKPNGSRIPPGLINADLISVNNAGTDGGRVFLQGNSEAIYQLHVPEGASGPLKLTLNTGGPVQAWVGYLYNWEQEKWEETQLVGQDIEVKDYAKYVNKAQQLRFKLTCQRGGFEVSGLTLSLGNTGGTGK